MSFLAPLFFAGLAAIAVPILVHLIQRERKDVIEFPSLMFIREIPYQSVERRRIHNWLLLLLRVGGDGAAGRGVHAAVLHAVDPVKAAAARTGAREVVILLDRSASMGYGDHWAQGAGRGAQDRRQRSAATTRARCVLFDTGAEEAVRATPDREPLEAAIRRGQGVVRRARATRRRCGWRKAC